MEKPIIVINTLWGIDFHLYSQDQPHGLYRIWDIGGQQRFANLWPVYLKNSHIICLNFSYDSIDSLKKLKRFLELAKASASNAKFIVVGSKANLPEHEKTVTDETVEEFLRANADNLGDDCQFVKVDAIDNVGITESLDDSKPFCSALGILAEKLASHENSIEVKETYFPKSYESLSKVNVLKSGEEQSPLEPLRQQVLKVLEDYSGYRPVLGIFSKAGFFHRGRHHRNEVKEIIDGNNLTSSSDFSVEGLVSTYNALSDIAKKPGGSLDRRVQLIKQLISVSRIDLGDRQLKGEQEYHKDSTARFNYSARP